MKLITGYRDVRSVVGGRFALCTLRGRPLAGDSPNAAQVLLARHPQPGRNFQRISHRSRKLSTELFFFNSPKNVTKNGKFDLVIDTTSGRLAAGQVLHGFPHLQSVPGTSSAAEDPFQVAPLVVFQVLRPRRSEQRVDPAGNRCSR